MTLIPECYKCHRAHVLMASVYTAGQYWMCHECIQEYEKETGTVAVFFYCGGIKFLSQEEYKMLEKDDSPIEAWNE